LIANKIYDHPVGTEPVYEFESECNLLSFYVGVTSRMNYIARILCLYKQIYNHRNMHICMTTSCMIVNYIQYLR